MKRLSLYLNIIKWRILLLIFHKFRLLGIDEKIFICTENDHEIQRALTFSVKEPDLIKWVQLWSKKDYNLIDVGSNVGIYSLYYASLNLNNTVYSFEPDPSSFNNFLKNISLNNLSNISPFLYALSDKSGIARFNYSLFRPGAGAGSLNSEYKFYKARKKISLFNYLETRCLDDFFDNELIAGDSILKIDVDGPEFQVLRGAKNGLMSGKIKSICIEINYENEDQLNEITKFLTNLNYFLVGTSEWIDFAEGFYIRNFYFDLH